MYARKGQKYPYAKYETVGESKARYREFLREIIHSLLILSSHSHGENRLILFSRGRKKDQCFS